MKRLILVILLLLTTLYSETTIDKNLSTPERAEVHIENLVDGGYYDEANIFLDEALKHYPNDIILLMNKGTALFNLKDLEGARKYFVLVLEKDPRNELASDFIELIEEQEEAKENKAVGGLVDYLSDSGLDFLMIFLAFLGGEIIARKYSVCTSNETVSIINKFKDRKKLSTSLKSRISFSFSECCLRKDVISFCSFLEILVTFTIVITLLIAFLLTEFVFNITLFISEPLLTLTENILWEHILYTFIVMIVITIFFRFSMKISSYDDNEEQYTIGIAEHLEKLYTSQEYKRLYAALESVSASDYDVFQCYMHKEEARVVVQKYVELKSTSTCN